MKNELNGEEVPLTGQRLFLSYSIDDRALMASALKELTGSSLNFVTVDDPADWGAGVEDVRAAIGAGIRKADAVLLLWSDQASRSPRVQYEIGMAQALDKPVQVLLVNGTNASIPAGLAGSHYTDETAKKV